MELTKGVKLLWMTENLHQHAILQHFNGCLEPIKTRVCPTSSHTLPSAIIPHRPTEHY